MPANSPKSSDTSLLAISGKAPADAPTSPGHSPTSHAPPSPAPAPISSAPLAPTHAPARQLADLPRDELDALAEEFGIDSTRFSANQDLVAAIHARRQLIASMDRVAMLDVARWGRRPVSINASNEKLAQEIARINSMRFAGLTQAGLIVLARLRGIAVADDETVPSIVRKLRKKEGFFQRIARKRRAMIGSLVATAVGESKSYQFLPPTEPANPASAAQASLKQEIEESGLLSGISNRIKKTADQYLNQKLDEIEARIDRKLEEIDGRLAEWRDKELANRLKILKITLWASAIVGIISLIYDYVKVYIVK
jgi:hypothetical protein